LCGGNRGHGRGGRDRDRGNGGRYGSSNSSQKPICQLCGKEGHTVQRCYKRFDRDFTGPTDVNTASSATTSYGIDTNWYLDTGASYHITGELEKLIMKEKYHGGDQVHVANGLGMKIDQIGRSFVRTPHTDLTLNKVLYVPQASKNLILVHKLALDNDAFLEFHPHHFLIKDRTTKRVLHRGRCEGGLYPFKSESNKQAHGAAIKTSSSRWHCRLGHPSSPIVRQILSDNKLSFVQESNNASVCDACQKGKSHQLPYPRSTSISNAPLDLVFSDVWGPAPTFVGKNKLYVSFIDDYSKFTWVYMLRHKSEVFQRFQDFQHLVERMFDQKILAMQTDWGGEYQKLNTFFQRIGISHHVSCPYAHQQNGSAKRKHRHIVEVGLSLLSHASMPLKFWDEAFITATYLINRLPSKVINHQTPLERLLHQKPDYSMLRTFGCACWPNMRPYNTRKLQFQSKRYVFIGYNILHKGFKCLDINEGRVYISRDVVFDEDVFPFSECIQMPELASVKKFLFSLKIS
jgi:histone deacetylase 1/2